MKERKFLDSNNQVVKYCKNYHEADVYCQQHNGDYPVGVTTPRQRAAVHFVKSILDVPFEGNIYDPRDVSSFLSEYLELAKQFYTGIKCDFEADRGY